MLYGIDLTKEEVPEHLHGLRETIRKSSVTDNDDAAYADIAFKLLKAVDGDKGALNEVAVYIQRQHRDLEVVRENYAGLLRGVSSWLYWAKNWTIKKPSGGNG